MTTKDLQVDICNAFLATSALGGRRCALPPKPLQLFSFYGTECIGRESLRPPIPSPAFFLHFTVASQARTSTTTTTTSGNINNNSNLARNNPEQRQGQRRQQQQQQRRGRRSSKTILKASSSRFGYCSCPPSGAASAGQRCPKRRASGLALTVAIHPNSWGSSQTIQGSKKHCHGSRKQGQGSKKQGQGPKRQGRGQKNKVRGQKNNVSLGV